MTALFGAETIYFILFGFILILADSTRSKS